MDEAGQQVETSSWARRRWARVIMAVATAAAIFAMATYVGMLVSSAAAKFLEFGAEGPRKPGELEAQPAMVLGIFLLSMQTATVLLSLLAARLFSPNGSARLLPLHWPKFGLGGILLSVVVLLILASAFGAAVYAFDRSAFAQDMKPFANMARTSAWWILLLAAAIGAPLAEELLFRGFLFGSIRQRSVGFAGAGVVTSVMWAALHASYSIYGMAMIIMIGFYFAYLREKSGTLIPSIACHAAYNGAIVLTLALSPENAISGI